MPNVCVELGTLRFIYNIYKLLFAPVGFCVVFVSHERFQSEGGGARSTNEQTR